MGFRGVDESRKYTKTISRVHPIKPTSTGCCNRDDKGKGKQCNVDCQWGIRPQLTDSREIPLSNVPIRRAGGRLSASSLCFHVPVSLITLCLHRRSRTVTYVHPSPSLSSELYIP